MIKWVRVYVSLKLFKRGDPPIVMHELWHRNWNKEILSGTTLLSTCLMNEWVDDWHYFSSALRYIRHIFSIFPCTRLLAGWRRRFWERRIGGGTCSVLDLGNWLSGSWTSLRFLLLVLLLAYISCLFSILIDFPWSGRQTRALRIVAEATLHQKLLRKSYLISRKAFFII